MTERSLAQRYLELVKRAVLNELYPELEAQLLYTVLLGAYEQRLDLAAWWQARDDATLREAIDRAKRRGETIYLQPPNATSWDEGSKALRNYTEYAHSMVGRARLNHLQHCVESVIEEGIPGDLLEAGVWRGGSCLLMRAVLAAHGDTRRTVWAADSYRGLPASEDPRDRGYAMSASELPVLSVPIDEVREVFRRYDLLDEQVRFIEGYFEASLADAPVDTLALLRIDADLYRSTRAVLDALYDRVAPGGWIVVDDYGVLPPCREAVDEFRRQRGIEVPLEWIDDYGVAWRRDAA